jgi:AAA+ ATPase superfamily predicted ATPase
MTELGFVDREEYLSELHNRYDRSQADLIVLYGRRRLGKSSLVQHSIRDRDDAVYWVATEETADVQLSDFVTAAADQYPTLANIRRDWEPLLQALGSEDRIVVIDEFPYLIRSNDAIASKFQRVWDTHLKDTEMTLVLVGSSVSIMEEKVLGGGSPLYGRRTYSIDLPSLTLSDAAVFYPSDEPDTILQSWGVFGGTPYYLRAIDRTRSLPKNIQSLILSEHGLLHNEPEFLLRTELGIREPQTYYTLLRAMAQGKRETNAIAQFAGLDSSTIGSYLTKLRRLRLIERDIPVTADPSSTRKSRYRLTEPLFRFWFRYVYGKQSSLASLDDSAYDQLVAPTFTDYMGSLFEVICQNALSHLLPKTYRKIGYWWHHEHELDVVGLASDGTLVAGECKYTSRQMDAGDLAHLEQTATNVRWDPPGGGDPDYQYCCFCRSGFSTGLREVAAERDDVSLFTPDDIVTKIVDSSISVR